MSSRRSRIARLATESFDVLVVGGGVTGLGVALDAASRGLSVALVEREDFSSGTSSKSSKLIHGGLRYLQQGEIGLVYEALHERQRLLHNAPHLVSILPFMIPVLTKDGVVSRRIARALGSALWMYDLTGGWRIGKFHRRIRAARALRHVPTMSAENLSSAYLYFDATADDSRLCVALARSAEAQGAVVLNHCSMESLHHGPDGALTGARVRLAEGEAYDVAARVVVNAAGVWSDRIRAADEGTDPRTIRPAKGVHLTVPWRLVRNDIAVVIPVKRDKRSLFVVPWIANGDGTYQFTYVGTTDTDFTGGVDESQCSLDDVDYVLEALNSAIGGSITRADVTGVWSGLRPLVAGNATGKTADLSRRHRVDTSPSGLVTVTGGKLTTYRKMAEHVVDAALARLGRRARCRTKRLVLVGGEGFDRTRLEGRDAHLAGRFGTEAPDVRALVAEDGTLAEPLVTGLPYLRAEAIWAVRHEQALTLDDVLTRRTRARLLDRRATLAAAPAVAALIAPELGWDEAERARQVAAFASECTREEVAATQSESDFLANLGSAAG